MPLSVVLSLAGVHLDRDSLMEFIMGEDRARRAALAIGDGSKALEHLQERDRLIGEWEKLR